MVSNRHLVSYCSKGLVTACLVLVSIVAVTAQQLTQVQYRLTGISLTVTPSALTVPRGVATQLNTTVTGATSLAAGAAVRATLRGPSFPDAIEIRATPNQPIFLPPLTQPGTHFLENIRLDIDASTSVRASPALVNINVLDQLLVGAVTSRPLSLAEIQQRGIVFDENSFQAFMFTVAFTTASGVRNIEVPVLVPVGTPEQQMLVGTQIPQLNLQQLPGLELPNFGLEALMLEPIEEAPPGVVIPPIPGILVIPGNIAFLNQFFSVFLTVSNRAPDGTPLVVRNVRAEISLPPGADGVMGNLQRDPPFVPGEPEYDNPLRVARTADGRQILKPVLAAGPDGVAGTADDIDVLAPQGSGSTEFLVEGIREGGHVIDITIRGTLEGLPSGPIEVAGHARGAVVVRDPNFSLTFIHPDVVRAGTQYDLTVQIRNTSLVDANLVTVSLDPRNMTGARLANPAQASQTIPTIRAGDSATVTLRLESLRTGRVTASTLELAGETGVVSGRRLSLRTGVSEQGVPLSSDTLILPPDVGRLRERANNDDLTGRAMALLGEAHSIATAPRASLPLGVLPIPSATVVQRAGELTSAARRLRLSYRAGAEGDAEPLPDGLLLTLQDLYFDFLGARVRDEGWDGLYRSSRQARLFGAALAEVVGRESLPLGLADLIALQGHWADTESYRSDHITVTTSAGGGQVPVTLEVTDRLGRRLGGSLDPEAGRREMPGADVLTFESADVPTGQFAVLTRTDGPPYTATLVAERAGTVDLGIIVPDVSDQLRHVVFRGVTVTAGERLTLTIRPRSDPPVTFDRAGVPVPATSQQSIVDGPPEVLGIVQMADVNIDRFGRVVGVLFDEDVESASAQNAESYVPGTASIPMIRPPALLDGNVARGALVQFGGRIVLVGLRDPVGPFIDRAIDISSVRDLKNQTMAALVGRQILPDPDIGDGGQVTGRVLRADGTPVGGAEITYLQPLDNPLGLTTLHVVSVKQADAEGRYSLDFVLQNPDGGFVIRARDLASDEQGELTAQVRANGERLSLDLVLVGRGSVEGVVRRQDGTPIANAAVRAISGTDYASHVGGTDQNGFYRITGVAVGPVALEVTTSTGSARAAGAISGSGRTSRIDVTVFGSAAPGVVTGVVRLPDGSSAPGIPVTLASEVSVAGDPLPATAFLDVRTTDAAGAFRFEAVPASGYLVRAIDKARGFIGDARITVTAAHGPDNPVSVVVFLAGTGTVSGQIRERVGTSTVPAAGALVAGGTQIVTADSDGRYTIPAVPVGSRVIEAANPLTGARGSREVTILTAGQVSTGIDIVLEPLARITGRVISPEGQPVAGQEVRLIVSEIPSLSGGRTFMVRKTQTAADGTYVFDQLDPREYPLTAVRGNEVANGRARLSSLVTQDVVDLRLVRPTGRVSGRVLDETNLAVAAPVTLKAHVPNAAGILELTNAGSTTSDPDRGFTFTGLFPGPFTATASSFFSPDSAAVSGTLPDGNPVADNVVLVLSRNTATLSGCVLAPDGTTITPVLDGTGVPLPLSVFITSGVLRNELAEDPLNTEPDGIRVDASGGCFTSSIPLPPDFYTIEVTDNRPGSPTFGLTGQAFASVERGTQTTQNVRLLGLGSIVVEVVDAAGQALPGVNVAVNRASYPNDTRESLLTVPTSTSPFVVEDLTEGPVAVSATVSLDPAVNVGGRDDLRGFGGRTTGAVVRDEQRILRVVIDSAGVVSGRFLRVDGSTPVNGAQVQLLSTGRPTAFTLTDATGAFRFDGVAVGGFQLDGFDPATGRRANVSGHLTQDAQHVIQDIRLGPIGTMRGVVLDATRTVPAPGAEVHLAIPNDSSGPRRATAALDGTFVFPSVPGGTATITAISLEGLSGRTEAILRDEGEVVNIEVLLEGSGRVEGLVRDANGALVPAAAVSLRSLGTTRTVQAGSSGAAAGSFAFDIVPIGEFTLDARPPGALTPGDGGRATVEITANGQTAAVDVAFQGTVTVGAVVSGAIGPAPVEVSVQSAGIFGGRATPTGQENGTFVFEGIPRAPMTLSARQTTPVGATISASITLGQGDLPPPSGRVVPDVQLVLTQVATIEGIVTAEDGQPVSGARISVSAGNTSTLALTQADGRFEFVGIPLNVALRVEADGLNGGRAVFIGSIDGNGNVLDRQGTTVEEVALSLDVTPPRIAIVTPTSGASAVPTNSMVAITFSEPIDPATITSCTSPGSTVAPTIRLLESSGTPPSINNAANLCDDSNVVPVTVAVSPDGRIVTLQPTRILLGTTPHIVTVSRGTADNEGTWSGGALDLVGLPLEAEFNWQFVTRDDVPPTVLTMSPPTGAVNVAEESVVRIAFSDPIAPASVHAASFAVVGPSGPVTGVRELILGSTVAVFTPTNGSGARALLQSNASYNVTVAGVIDLAGNAQRPQDIATATFNTRDTIAPTISSISAPAGARSSESVTLVATTTQTDVASVEFFVDGVLSAGSSQAVAPGEFRASVVMPSRNIQVAARAIDTTGNVGVLGTATAIALLPDNPPVVTIDSPATGTSVAAGKTVRFSVTATDDLAVKEIRAASSGVVTTTSTRPVSPARTPVTESFDIAIPESTVSGSLTFAAAATDRKGQLGPTASVTVNVTGVPPPVISSVSPSTAEQGQTLDVAIAGQDTNFAQGTTTASFGAGVTVNGLKVTGVTSAIANVTIADAAVPGKRTVTVTTGSKTASLVDGFEVIAGTAVVTTLSPNSATQGETVSLNISGRFTHFAQGVTTADFGPGVTVDGLTVTSATSATATITVSPIAATGPRNATLTTGAEVVTLAALFSVLQGTAAISQVSPVAGQQGQTLDVSVSGSGTHFQAQTVASFGSGIVVNTLTVHNVTSATANISIDASAQPGARTVTLTTSGEVASLADGFTVQPGTPGLLSATPNTGLRGQELVVVVTGRFTTFLQGTTIASFGPGISVGGAPEGQAGPVSVTTAESLTASLVVSASAAPGSRDITIQTASETLTLANGFAVTDVTGPVVTSVSPADGASDVAVDTAVEVTFNEAVNPSTVTTSTFRLVEMRTTPLVVNGDFDADATGWSASNVDGSGGWFASGGNPGGYFILNDSGGATDPTISQVVSGLAAGQRYRLSGQFVSAYSSLGDPSALSFGVLIDNVLAGELARPPEGTWQEFAFEFTATSSAMTISLAAERNGDDSSYGVDSILLEPILSGTIAVAVDALSATFTPATSLRPGTAYRVEVVGVADASGQSMSAPFRSSFVTAVVVGADTDGDGFPDTVEIEAGSDPSAASSTPITTQPITEAASARFMVLNTSTPTDTTDPALFVGEAVSAPFSLLNTSDLNDVTDPAVFVGEVVSAPVLVLNTTNLSEVTDPAVFIGEAVSPTFVVENTTSSQTSTNQAAAAVSQQAGQQLDPTEPVAPVVSLVAPSNGQTIFEGQTISVAVDVTGDQTVEAMLVVNGTPLAQDDTVPYAFTFTTPANVTSVTIQVSVSNSAGTGASPPVTLSVIPDPGTTVIGRLLATAGMPIVNRDVTVTLSGLQAEFFDSTTPLTALPDVNGLVPTYTRSVSAVNVRNPSGVFGADPFGVGLTPDFAARLSGYLWIEQPGEYVFRLGADEGARLVIGGTTVVQMPTGRGELQVYSQAIQLSAGWVPIEVTYYESIGDAELQLQYQPPGGELQIIPPGRLRATMTERRVRTDALGQFVITNVPANVPAIRVSGESGDLSPLLAPVPGGVTDVGDLVIE